MTLPCSTPVFLRVLTTTVMLGAAQASAWSGEETTSDSITSKQILEQAIGAHRSLPGGATIISTTIEHADGRQTAPPTRSGFAFLRETDEHPARVRSECWSCPGGDADLVSDGQELFLGDPIRQIYRTADAPSTLKAFLENEQTMPYLGIGEVLLMSWLTEGNMTFQPVGEPRRTIVGERAAHAIKGIAPGPAGDTLVEYTFAAVGNPLLLAISLPMPGGQQVRVTFGDWKTRIAQSRGFPESFVINDRNHWQEVAQLSEPGNDETIEPVRKLIGQLAPPINIIEHAGTRLASQLDDSALGRISVVLFWDGEDEPGQKAMQTLEMNASEIESGGGHVFAIQVGGDHGRFPGLQPDAPMSSKIHGHAHGHAESIARNWQLSALPTLAVIDLNGVVRAVQVGYPGREAMTNRLFRIIEELQPRPVMATVSEDAD